MILEEKNIVESTSRPMDFQEATARHIFEILTDGTRPHRRVLLADEVGLGKTIVAKNVVSLIRDYQRNVKKKKTYRVVYVCSNINIARQNLDKLGVKYQMNASGSRLSMQHLYIEQTLNLPEVIIPLTPTTSFDFRSSTGLASERALICVILEHLEEFSEKRSRDALEKFFMCNVTKEDNWKDCLKGFKEEVEKRIKESDGKYMAAITRGLRRKDGAKVLRSIEQYIGGGEKPSEEKTRIISAIRKIFAEISIASLKPDLVIMDEFQRFKSLLTGENEQSLLARRFFERPSTMVLLLSATPYKAYTTFEDLVESGADGHYDDFMEVMGFLQEGDETRREHFENAWQEYNVRLTSLGDKDASFDAVVAAKNGAEDSLYGIMSRTERFNGGGIETRKESLPVLPEDIKSYFEARSLLDELGRVASSSAFRSLPIDYVKSSSYLMSFMDRYTMKEYVRDNRRRLGKRDWPLLYLPLKRINEYRDVPSGNARLRWLEKSLFTKGVEAEKLLWVPASKPYYKTHHQYAGKEGFSKTLVFSAWQMVPRMIACMVSYDAEKLVVNALRHRGRSPGKYFKPEDKETKTKRYGADRLARFKDGENPLCYVCKTLADLYKPSDHIGKDINDIIEYLTPKVKEEVDRIVKQKGIPIEKKATIKNLTLMMRLLDDDKLDLKPEKISEDTVRDLVLAAIGSPAICAYRLHEDTKQGEEIGTFFEQLFNKADAYMVVRLCGSGEGTDYVEEILEYCVEGNLQAVLEEYDHVLEGKWERVLKEGPMDVGSLSVEMQGEDHEVDSRMMRTWMAMPFTNAKMEDKAVAHTTSLMSAFNSPFRPFVLCTTSIGQEGLDFHWYARRLLHWNLPSNAVDMEQREGRVNRYKCLSIRQRLAERYPDAKDWDEVFEKAKAEFKRSDSDIVPYWCLPPDFPEGKDKMVERIILEYPLSQDRGRYEHLVKVLSLYRLTLGHPRQEDLLKMLESYNLTEEQIQGLLIELSPFYREKKNT